MPAFDFPSAPAADQIYSPAGGPVYIWKNPRWMVDSSIITVNGIKFPATAVLSADPNTIDDYEEGLWEPSWGVTTGAFGTIVYDATNNWGHYTRVGRICHCVFRTGTTSVVMGTASGQIWIAGLPFTAVVPAGTSYSGVMNYPAYAASWTTLFPAGALMSSGHLLLYSRATTVASSGALSAANMLTTAGNGIIGAFSYTVS